MRPMILAMAVVAISIGSLTGCGYELRREPTHVEVSMETPLPAALPIDPMSTSFYKPPSVFDPEACDIGFRRKGSTRVTEFGSATVQQDDGTLECDNEARKGYRAPVAAVEDWQEQTPGIAEEFPQPTYQEWQ